jgi:cysteine-rich repeat protein
MWRILTGPVGLLALAAAPSVGLGCAKPSDSIVVIAVDADPDVTGVVQLRAMLSLPDDGSASLRSFPSALPSSPLAFPTAFSVTFDPSHTGELDVALDGVAADTRLVANGSGSVRIDPGHRVDGSITLHAGASLCGNGRLDPGEQCDDGDRISSGTCDFQCMARVPPSDGGAGGGAGGAGGASDGGGGAGGAGGGGGSTPDAGSGGNPCVPTSLLVNGGFDDGDTGWSEMSDVRTTLIVRQGDPALVAAGVAPESPAYLAWLGGGAIADNSVISQQVTIPNNAVHVSVRGFIYITTLDDPTTPFDTANAEIVNGASTLPLSDWSNADHSDAWVSFDASVVAVPLRGMTVTFQVRSFNDDELTTSFFLDSLSLIATCN